MSYTPEMITRMTEVYVRAPNLESVALLADEFNRPQRSVISKLGILGIYKKKVYTNKTGVVPIKKSVYIENIANMLSIDPALLESWEKATKYSLVLVEKEIERLKALSEVSA